MSLAKPTDPILVVSNLDARMKPKVVEKLFQKHGKIISCTEWSEGGKKGVRVEFDSPELALLAKTKLNGKVALKKKMVVQLLSEARAASTEETIDAIEKKLQKLEDGDDAEDEQGKIGKYRNSFLFNRGGSSGSAVWNGIGTTKTKRSQTLFIANIPYGRFKEIQNVFKTTRGFSNVGSFGTWRLLTSRAYQMQRGG